METYRMKVILVYAGGMSTSIVAKKIEEENKKGILI
jgi:cellobiose-specific phosphotransferase system component IIB